MLSTLELNDILRDLFITLCTSKKYPYSPSQKGLEFPGDEGFCKTPKFKNMCEAVLFEVPPQKIHSENFRGSF